MCYNIGSITRIFSSYKSDCIGMQLQGHRWNFRDGGGLDRLLAGPRPITFCKSFMEGVGYYSLTLEVKYAYEPKSIVIIDGCWRIILAQPIPMYEGWLDGFLYTQQRFNLFDKPYHNSVYLINVVFRWYMKIVMCLYKYQDVGEHAK